MPDFPLTVDWRALDALLADAVSGERVHELMRLAHPGHMLSYARLVAPADTAVLLWRIVNHEARHPEHASDATLVPCLPLSEMGHRIEWEDESDLALEHAWMLAQNVLPSDEELGRRLDSARATQAALRHSGNARVMHQLALIDAGRHPRGSGPEK